MPPDLLLQLIHHGNIRNGHTFQRENPFSARIWSIVRLEIARSLVYFASKSFSSTLTAF